MLSKSILVFDKRGNDRIPPPPYRVPKMHPQKYYKTGNHEDTLLKLMKQHKEAFSLRDEIGKCPNIKIDIDVVDDSPFFPNT